MSRDKLFFYCPIHSINNAVLSVHGKDGFKKSFRDEQPLLDGYGITPADFDHIVAHSRDSSMKTNPVVLDDEEIVAVLAQRCNADCRTP